MERQNPCNWSWVATKASLRRKEVIDLERQVEITAPKLVEDKITKETDHPPPILNKPKEESSNLFRKVTRYEIVPL
jgi:hypothetical protein